LQQLSQFLPPFLNLSPPASLLHCQECTFGIPPRPFKFVGFFSSFHPPLALPTELISILLGPAHHLDYLTLRPLTAARVCREFLESSPARGRDSDRRTCHVSRGWL
jgi:hypothetical protein